MWAIEPMTNTLATVELPATGYIRQKQLLMILPFSSATLWRKVANDPSFPKPVKLSERVTAWNVVAIRE
jgi:predicted DNA-binding transcriptional regulator AlpA